MAEDIKSLNNRGNYMYLSATAVAMILFGEPASGGLMAIPGQKTHAEDVAFCKGWNMAMERENKKLDMTTEKMNAQPKIKDETINKLRETISESYQWMKGADLYTDCDHDIKDRHDDHTR